MTKFGLDRLDAVLLDLSYPWWWDLLAEYYQRGIERYQCGAHISCHSCYNAIRWAK